MFINLGAQKGRFHVKSLKNMVIKPDFNLIGNILNEPKSKLKLSYVLHSIPYCSDFVRIPDRRTSTSKIIIMEF